VNLHVADKSWVYARVLEGRAVVVAFNTDAVPATLDVAADPAGLADGVPLEDRLGSGATASVEGGRLRIALPARESAIFVPR